MDYTAINLITVSVYQNRTLDSKISVNLITVSVYQNRTLDSKISVNYLSQSSTSTGKPTQFVSSLNTGMSKGT